MPVLISIVIAYLLQPIVELLKRWRCPNLVAVLVVYLLFIGLFVFLLVVLLPSLWKQLANLVNELPRAFSQGQTWFTSLSDRYPSVFATPQFQHLMGVLKTQSLKVGQDVVKYSIGIIPNIITAVLYFILVPLLVFFFMKDREPILAWFTQYLPKRRGLVLRVWAEVRGKIGAYVNGRVIEIFIVGIVSAITFAILGLEYSALLGALVGLSVIIPYIGAIVVTIPVAIVALMQWGLAPHFFYVLIAFGIIITLDGNVLVPFLFSEAMALHPVVIILAVVVFGGIWGFWGIFFAIPLATLVRAVLAAWPRDLVKD